MRKKYVKPTCRVKDLKPRVLVQASNIHVYTSESGILDAKASSFGYFEEDFEDDY